MPTYAYRCEQCGETFERIETISEREKAKPPCPKCGSDKVVSVPTPFHGHNGQEELAGQGQRAAARKETIPPAELDASRNALR